MKPKKTRRRRLTAFVIILATFAVLFTTLVLAYYLRSTVEAENSFAPAGAVTPNVVETLDGNTMENVCIEVGNTGYPVYVRAEIVLTWKDSNGSVFFSQPVLNTDYTLTLNTTDWEKGANGNYYYCKTPTESGRKTPALITHCEQITDMPEYTLNVEILTQTVQAVGTTDTGNVPAWKDAWGLK